MLVRVNTSLSGADFNFRFGEEVEQELFAARVGNGWESLCEPIAEEAVSDPVEEVSVAEPVAEVAVVEPVVEVAAKQTSRGRRK